ncbi:peptidoglycan editing factor PgeF [soil metagenome]
MRSVTLGRRVRAAVTGRSGGVSAAPYAELNLGGRVGDDPIAVADNRARLADGLGLGGLAFMEQVHGADVAVAARAGETPHTDGLVTVTAGLGLVVLVADCTPVLLADDTAGVVGAVHAGRRGLAGAIVVRAVEVMAEAGAHPNRVAAWLGPAVCGGCYEVPAELRDEVDAAAPGSAATTRAGTPAVDIRAGLRRQLRDAGVRDVTVDATCTMEDPAYFSYRRDHVTGRFAGVVWLAE